MNAATYSGNPATASLNGRTALTCSALKGNDGIVNGLLASGAAADYISEDGGHSPLLEAVRLRHERVIRTLLAAGADATLTYTVEARTLYTEQAFSGRLTALHLIAMEQKPPPSQELVKPAEEDAEHEEMERRQVWWWDGTRAPSQPLATPHPPLRTRCQPQDCAPTTLCTL